MLKKINLLCFIILISVMFSKNVMASNIDKIFEKTYGGSGNDSFYTLIHTTDGGYLAVGESTSPTLPGGITNKGEQDGLIVKFDRNMNVVWQRTLGGSKEDVLHSVVEIPGQEYMAVGYSNSTDIPGLLNKGNQDAIVVGIDNDGNFIWKKNYGGSNKDTFHNISKTTNGKYVAVGFTRSTDIPGITINGEDDFYMVELNTSGNATWQKNYGGNYEDAPCITTSTSDGGFISSGYMASTNIPGITLRGGEDSILVKFDANGNPVLAKAYGGSSLEYFQISIEASDGGIVAIGYTGSTDVPGITNKGGSDGIIVKYDSLGNMLWQKNYGGSGEDFFQAIIEDNDGGYIVEAYSDSTDIQGITNKGGEDIIMLKYDKDGNLLWQESNGGNGYETLYYFLRDNNNEGYLLAGYTSSTNIPGITNNGGTDAYMFKYTFKHMVYKQNTENGTFTLDKDAAFKGEKVNISVTPNTGYKLKSIKVLRDSNNQEIAVNNNSFIMPETNVKVKVEFMEEKDKDDTPKTGHKMNNILLISIVLILFSLKHYKIKYMK